MKEKTFIFNEKEVTLEDMLELDVKDEVRDTPAFKEIIKDLPPESEEYVAQEFDKMTADWQIAYDMIAKAMDDENIQDMLREKLKEKYG